MDETFRINLYDGVNRLGAGQPANGKSATASVNQKLKVDDADDYLYTDLIPSHHTDFLD